MLRSLAGLRIALLVLICACASFAQRDLATLAGTITDPSGGVVTNAVVTITEVATGQVYQITTNNVGEYVRPALKASTYNVSVSAPGFKKSETANVILTPGERTAVNITLTVGDVGQTVEVQASGELLQTESTQVGAALDSKTVTDVPLGGTRNLAYLARLSPGVVPAEPGARDAANGGFSANGVRSNGQNNFLLNGVDNNINTIDFLNQTAYAIGPAIDAVSEVSVQTNGYSAEYGRAAGGVINVVLKSGTNALHGSLFEYLANKDFDANTWSNDRAGQPIGPFVQNQFGAAAGGPIKKNQLFMFGDYQGTRIADSGGSVPNLGYSGYTTVPTPAMKTGNFSSLLGPSYTGTDINGNPISFAKGMIYDPASTTYCTSPCANVTTTGFQIPTTRTPFPGNIIPQSRFDPAWAKIIQLLSQSQSGSDYRQRADQRLLLQHDRRSGHRPGRRPRRLSSQREGQPLRLVELVEYFQVRRRSAAWRSGRYGFQRSGRNRSQPQRANELHACLGTAPGDGDPPGLHSPGDLAHRRQPRHRSVPAVRYWRL